MDIKKTNFEKKIDLLKEDVSHFIEVYNSTYHYDNIKIGRAHVWTPVTLIYLVCRLLLEKKKKKKT